MLARLFTSYRVTTLPKPLMTEYAFSAHRHSLDCVRSVSVKLGLEVWLSFRQPKGKNPVYRNHWNDSTPNKYKESDEFIHDM